MRNLLRGFKRVGVFFVISVILVVVSLGSTSDAAINPQINFQGKLTNTDGTNVTNGTYSIVFSIYTVASGGSNIWTETQSSVSVTDGIFRVALGSVTSLPGSVDFNTNAIYLGIKVGADAEMTPRVQFTASPYAFNSDKLGGLTSSGFLQLGPSAVQADASTNSSVFINKTAAGNLVQLQSTAVDVFTVTATGDVTFGQNASHTISILQEATANTAGNNLSLIAGQAGAGTGATGGNLVLQGGAAAGTNGSGGNVTIAAGALTGSGAVGSVIVKNPSDSTTAFQIQDAAGTTLLVADATNDRIYVGSTTADAVGTLLVLDTKNTAGDPAGTNGGMYYNSNEQRYRCYRGINATAGDGAWEDCTTASIDRSYSIEEEFFFGGTTSGTIGANGWATSTITTAPTYTYNNAAAPAPSSDRPGILRMSTVATANRGGTLSLGTASTRLGVGQVVRASVAMTAVGANTEVMRIGLHNETTTTTAPTTGVWWEYSPASSLNWRYCYSNATPTATCANTATPPVANTFDALEIRITALGVGVSSVDYFLNGVKSNVNTITVNTTNTVAPAMTCYTLAATARNCFIDYFQFLGGSGVRR